jgi:NAD(P)-dependent dehydrogenase (short-subunit alcohol dehydrogenase family)
MFSLSNKVVVITGASSGIGRQCAIACSKMGASLVLFDRNKEQMEYTVSQLEGESHLSFIQDIREIDSFESAIKKVVKECGAIDGFIHSAGIQTTLPIRLHSKEIYYDQLDINCLGGFECCRILSQNNYFNSKGGSIIFIASIRGLLGAAYQVGYAVSKGAVIAGTKSLAIELAFRNIRVNSISPGMVEGTSMTNNVIENLPPDWSTKNKMEYPLGWVKPEDIAHTCVFLLSDESRMITGTNIIVDGGFSAK